MCFKDTKNSANSQRNCSFTALRAGLKRQPGDEAQPRVVNPKEAATRELKDLESRGRDVENRSRTQNALKGPQRELNELEAGHLGNRS